MLSKFHFIPGNNTIIIETAVAKTIDRFYWIRTIFISSEVSFLNVFL